MIFKCQLLFLIFVMMSGCATYQDRINKSRSLLESGECDKSLTQLKELSDKEGGDQLAYLMDYGSALQICQKYKESNEVLEKAEKLSELNDYHSVSRVAGATLLNEEMLQYKGDAFEKVFLNISKAINYLQLDQLDDAMVEVRKINEKYKKFSAESKKNYELNPFAQYLSGLIYEAEKQFDDACISYKQAFLLDSTYNRIGLDALRSCMRAKRDLDVKELTKKINSTSEISKTLKNSKDTATLVIIYLQGVGPRKQPRMENRIAAKLVPEHSQYQKLKIKVDGNATNEVFTETVYDVTQVAIKTLNDEYGALVARRIGARVAKEVVADQVRQKDQLLGSLVWLAMVASERADLRQWSLLPNTIQIAKFNLTSGSHTLKIEALDSSNSGSLDLPELQATVAAGQTKIVVFRTIK